VGCGIDINALDRDIFHITAAPYDKYIEGELCRKGRFESSYLKRAGRITACSESGKGEVSLEAAARSVAAGLGAIREEYGNDSILFLVSPSATREEVYLVSTLAAHFGSSFISSAEDLMNGAIPDIRPSVKREDIANADVIVNVGAGLTTDNPVFGFQVKRAISKGTSFIQIGRLDPELKRYGALCLDCETGREGAMIDTLAKRIMKGVDPRSGNPADAVAALLRDTDKKTIIIINNTVAPADVKKASDLSALTGRDGSGVLLMQKGCNTRGYRDIVFNGASGFSSAEKLGGLGEALKKGGVRAVFSLNEDIDIETALPDGVEFIAALSAYPSGLTAAASVTIPYSPYIENEGSVVSFDGRVVGFEKVFEPLPGFSNTDSLNALLSAVAGEVCNIEEIRNKIG
jgi:predicted molibdopterin-dependent oxidoreductase YjgC